MTRNPNRVEHYELYEFNVFGRIQTAVSYYIREQTIELFDDCDLPTRNWVDNFLFAYEAHELNF